MRHTVDAMLAPLLTQCLTDDMHHHPPPPQYHHVMTPLSAAEHDAQLAPDMRGMPWMRADAAWQRCSHASLFRKRRQREWSTFFLQPAGVHDTSRVALLLIHPPRTDRAVA